MARVFAPHESYNCDLGVDFINGVAVVPDADTWLQDYFTNAGYLVVPGVDQLSVLDKTPLQELELIAAYLGVDPIGKTKAALIGELETQLSRIKIEISSFDALANVPAGTVAEPLYANAAAVRAVLPTTVYCDAGSVGVPVASWTDTDTFDKTTAGSYTFTAVPGTLPTPFANTGGYTATVEVVVSP